MTTHRSKRSAGRGGSFRAFALAVCLAALVGGVCRLLGEGTRAYERGDYAAAWKAFENPAAAEFQDALYARGMMLAKGLGVTADEDQALALFTRASGTGHIPSMLAAGDLLRKRPDGRRKAMDFFEEAATRGDLAGMTALAAMLAEPDSPAPDPVRALALTRRAADGGYVPAQAALGRILRDQAMLAGDRDVLSESASWLTLAADGGDPESCHILGLMYREGTGVPADPARAAALFSLAAQKGYAPSQEIVADMYASGEGVKRYDLEAANWYARAAEGGNEQARFKLADMYLEGRGVFRDKAEALRLYRLSGETDPQIQDRLCAMFSTGILELRDQAEAAVWCRKAAEAGMRDSQRLLGLMLLRGLGVDPAPEEAAAWLSRADQAGDATAGYALGLMYLGGMGLARDYGLALDHVRKAAESGLPEAQYFLASMYDEELRSTNNYARALSWYRKAAESGDVRARFNLGSMYGKGLGSPQDYDEAYVWFKLAAEQGDPRAQYNAGLMRLTGKGAAEDAGEAFRWMLMAAKQGDARAQFNAGSMYLSGRGTPVDTREAVRWYRLSALQGFGPAQSMLSSLYYEGRRLPRSFSEAYYWIALAAASPEDFSGRERSIQAKELLGRRLSRERRAEIEERAAAFAPRKINPEEEKRLLPPLQVIETPELNAAASPSGIAHAALTASAERGAPTESGEPDKPGEPGKPGAPSGRSALSPSLATDAQKSSQSAAPSAATVF